MPTTLKKKRGRKPKGYYENQQLTKNGDKEADERDLVSDFSNGKRLRKSKG